MTAARIFTRERWHARVTRTISPLMMGGLRDLVPLLLRHGLADDKAHPVFDRRRLEILPLSHV
jgi:hypothetical protein